MTPLDSGARFQETSEISDLTPSDRNTQQGKSASFVNVIQRTIRRETETM